MKCHRNALPYRACFASRSCARFSPTTSMPASASTPSSSTETYFVAATTVTPEPASARIASESVERMMRAQSRERRAPMALYAISERPAIRRRFWTGGSALTASSTRVAGSS